MELLRYTALVLYGLSAIIMVLKNAQMFNNNIPRPLWMKIFTAAVVMFFLIAVLDLTMGFEEGLFLMRVLWNVAGGMFLVGTIYTVYWKK